MAEEKTKKGENVHSEHRKRLKNRFLTEGLSTFENHNVLELLLFYAVPQIDTNPLGHRLIRRFGSLSGVFEADYDDLLEIEGVGPNVATLLKLIPELSMRYMTEERDDIFLINSQAAGKFIMPYLMACKEEQVYAMLLDTKMRLIRCTLVQKGSFNTVEVNLRKIAQLAIQSNASNLILAHNHPGGTAIPSAEDNDTTIKVKKALEILGVVLCDHIIVADKDFISFADTYASWKN